MDVRDPLDLTSYGYASQGVLEVWDSMWLPVYDRKGRQTSRKTDIVYSIDLVRGLDVYSVDLPGAGGRTAVTATDTGLLDAALPIGLVGSSMLVVVGLRRRASRG